jgi:hypothetical protein
VAPKPTKAQKQQPRGRRDLSSFRLVGWLSGQMRG